MKAQVDWHHGLTFTGTADTGFQVNLGASPAVGGDDDGFRPLELMLVSLAGCTGMDVMSILTKMRQEVTQFQVRIEADRAERHPKVFTAVRVHYAVQGRNIHPDSVARAVELSKNVYCPVSAMLSQAVPIKHTFEITAEAD